MSHVLLWLLLVVSLLLQTCGVNSKGSNTNSDEEKLKSNGGTTVMDLVKQCICQPRETIIKVYDEFPNEMQYDILPRCVPLRRCLGCCGYDADTCIPKKNKTVEIEVLRIYSESKNEMIKLEFVQHTRCGCGSKRNKN